MGGVALTGPRGAIGCYPADGGPTLVSARDGRADGHGRGRRRVHDQPAARRGRQRRAGDEPGRAPSDADLAGGPRERPGTPRPERPEFLRPDPRGVNGPWCSRRRGVLLALWQARRLGPVVAERLPVVVRAAETVEGRGRLYRARRARDRAAAALRAASSTGSPPGSGCPRPPARTRSSRRPPPDRPGPARAGHRAVRPAPADEAGLVALAACSRTWRLVSDEPPAASPAPGPRGSTPTAVPSERGRRQHLPDALRRHRTPARTPGPTGATSLTTPPADRPPTADRPADPAAGGRRPRTPPGRRWERCAPRSPRPSSARTPWSPGW